MTIVLYFKIGILSPIIFLQHTHKIFQEFSDLLKKLSIVVGSGSSDDKVTHPKFDDWSLSERNPEAIKAWMPIWEWFYRYYFRVQTKGWQHMPSTGKVLVVGSHNGGLGSPDTSMFMYDWFRCFGYKRLAYALMHPAAWQNR